MRRSLGLARRIGAVAILVLMGGCSTIGTSKPEAALTAPDDAYFVFGVDPPYTRLGFLGGTLENGGFSATVVFMMEDLVLMDEPTDGFVLGKIKGTKWVDVDLVQPHSSASALFGPLYHPCTTSVGGYVDGYNPTPVFEVPAGKVVYITSAAYSYDSSGSGLNMKFHTDLEGARAFLRKHYPNLADKLEQGSYRMLRPDHCRM